MGGFVLSLLAYWAAQLSTTADIEQAFSDLAAAGYTTLRTWGFNDVTAVQYACRLYIVGFIILDD